MNPTTVLLCIAIAIVVGAVGGFFTASLFLRTRVRQAVRRTLREAEGLFNSRQAQDLRDNTSARIQ